MIEGGNAERKAGEPCALLTDTGGLSGLSRYLEPGQAVIVPWRWVSPSLFDRPQDDPLQWDVSLRNFVVVHDHCLRGDDTCIPDAFAPYVPHEGDDGNASAGASDAEGEGAFFRRDASGSLGVLGVVSSVGSNFLGVSVPLVSKWGRKEIQQVEIRVHDREIRLIIPVSPASVDAIVAYGRESGRQAIAEAKKRMAECLKAIGASTGGFIPEAGSGETALVALAAGETPQAAMARLTTMKDVTLPAIHNRMQRAVDSLTLCGRLEELIASGLRLSQETILQDVQSVIDVIGLYANAQTGVTVIHDGTPALPESVLHVFQRVVFMDEESLLDYAAGGMDFQSVDAWGAWLAMPHNRDRVMPYPRSLIVARVRRAAKDYEPYLSSVIRFDMNMENGRSYIFVRDGDRILRVDAQTEFTGNMAFSDPTRDLNTPKMFSLFCGRISAVVQLDPDAIDPDAIGETGWKAMTRESVYYDDAARWLKSQTDQYRNLGVIIQGLFDQCVLDASRPVRVMAESERDDSAVRFVYDGERAIHSGEKPDFEAYRARLNKAATDESLFTGQRDYWLLAEGRKETARAARMASGRAYMQAREIRRYAPQGDPGPSAVQRAASRKGSNLTFAWERDCWSGGGARKIRVPMSALLNVSAYRAGDFRQFFNDPRTRAEYLQWAYLLLAAEDHLSGGVTA